MLLKNLKSGAFAALLAATVGIGWGCSVTSNSTGGGDCISRCTAIADKCGGSSSKCNETCEQVTSAQLTCIEDADCDDEQSIACLVSSDGSDDTSTTVKDSGDNKAKDSGVSKDAGVEDSGVEAPDAGVFADNVYETSNMAIQGYVSLGGISSRPANAVAKLTLYIQADGTYVFYYREGQGTVSPSGFSGGFFADGKKLTGDWSVSGDTLTAGDVLSCTKAASKVTCVITKEFYAGIKDVTVPMTSSNSKSPTDATEWKAYK